MSVFSLKASQYYAKSVLLLDEKVINSDTDKAVHIVDSEEIETLYGMTEQEFIEKAKVLPPRTKKEEEQQ